MLENIYIARHGFRADFLDANDTHSPTGMWHDPRLSDSGLAQAEELGAFLSNPPAPLPKPELLFSSPFFRTLQTAQPLAKSIGQPVHLENGIAEWFSKAEPNTGLHSRPYPAKELQRHFPDMMLHPTYQPTYYPKREGETLQELQERADMFVEAWVRRVEAEYPRAKTAVLFSHAAMAIALGRALLGDNDHDVGASTASLSLYRRRGLPPIAGLSHIQTQPRLDRYGAGTPRIRDQLQFPIPVPTASTPAQQAPAGLVGANEPELPGDAHPALTDPSREATLRKVEAAHPELVAMDAQRTAESQERRMGGQTLRNETAAMMAEGDDPQVALAARREMQRQGVDVKAFQAEAGHVAAMEPVLGAWDQLINGGVEHLANGSESNWNFSMLVYQDNGQDVEFDQGDSKPFTEEDKNHHGLGDGLHHYVERFKQHHQHKQRVL